MNNTNLPAAIIGSCLLTGTIGVLCLMFFFTEEQENPVSQTETLEIPEGKQYLLGRSEKCNAVYGQKLQSISKFQGKLGGFYIGYKVQGGALDEPENSSYPACSHGKRVLVTEHRWNTLKSWIQEHEESLQVEAEFLRQTD